MSARIKFETLTGKPSGFVDLQGDKVVGSNSQMEFLIEDFYDLREDASAQDFIDYYGNPKRKTSFLYSKLVDSEDDTTNYPA